MADTSDQELDADADGALSRNASARPAYPTPNKSNCACYPTRATYHGCCVSADLTRAAGTV